MSRLIDADLLMRKCEKWLKPKAPDEDEMVSLADIAVSMLMEIEEQPTAFDVENVVSNLEQLKLDEACNYKGCADCQYLDKCWDGDMSEEHAINMAIEIVKRGGLDES